MTVAIRWEHKRARLRAIEWILLLFGLAAVDTYIWVNTSTLLYQAYEDWSFDQALRALKPTVPGFVRDELAGSKADAPPAEKGSETDPVPVSLIGRLEIPRLHLAAIVREGADSGTLRRAVGHIPGTALPGKSGNVAFAGHRDTFFRSLRGIQKSDVIEVQTVHGTYRYIVDSTKIVTPRDTSVLAASNHQTLTLVTCYPFYYVGSAPKRFIVRASQVGTVEASTQPRQPLPGS